MSGVRIELSGRERAILRAVEAGRGVLISSCEPGLTVDGRWCDHVAVHNLLGAGLIKGARQVGYGQPTLAVVTAAGQAVLAGSVEFAA
ncbi:hypothetical protein SD37_09315 [Amycolatopsis orientalis]|uniref:Uncharacterized protein n=1 Tax=Amycolatopsis orientalis TaxID=31958 RepID=A0A193CBH7_AMYOR|nr:hypothetical protein [Amycolatopsis orientalis]ANN21660.1 hypothetical protein SD37_09315 [Amycolatopsis orientalis]